MHVTPPIVRSFREEALAQAVLGDREPFVGALARYATALAQLSVAVGLVVAAAVAHLLGGAGAVPVAAGAGVAALGFGLRTIVRATDVHDGLLQLVVAGRGGAPVPAVQRGVRRLLEPAHVGSLARAYEEIGSPPDAGGLVAHHAYLIAVPSVMAAVRPELLTVARLLRADRPPARGVAAAERLLRAPESPLFGRDVELLSQDLRRIAFLLDS